MKTSTPEANRGRLRFSATYLLFGLNLLLAAALIALVMLAPLLPGQAANPNGWSRLFQLFGQDAAVRRTALAAAAGLVVTAWVFFRVPVSIRVTAPRTVRVHMTPSNVVGA
jgi:hypothetical protein